MRTDIELLRIIRSEVPTSGNIGICTVIHHLFRDLEIIYEEAVHMFKYIKNHRPQKGSIFYDPKYKTNVWYWKRSDRAIRVKWLTYLIFNAKWDALGLRIATFFHKMSKYMLYTIIVLVIALIVIKVIKTIL